MKVVSPLTQKKARIEIIPLIDIMFFLLASFMLVSLSMTKQHTISVNLPGAGNVSSRLETDTISLAVNSSGQVFLQKEAITLEDLEVILHERLAANRDLPVYISGDTLTPHGSMVAVLDYVKRCGVTKVAFNVKTPES